MLSRRRKIFSLFVVAAGDEMRSHDSCYRSPIRHPFIFPRPGILRDSERQNGEATEPRLVPLMITENRNILTVS